MISFIVYNQKKNHTSSWISFRSRPTPVNTSINVVKLLKIKNGSLEEHVKQLLSCDHGRLASIESSFCKSEASFHFTLITTTFLCSSCYDALLCWWCCFFCYCCCCPWAAHTVSCLPSHTKTLLSIVIKKSRTWKELYTVISIISREYSYNHCKLKITISNDVESNPGPPGPPTVIH